MSEQTIQEMLANESVTVRLTREAGILAGRLAQFLTTSMPDAGPSLVDGREFLQAFFESVAGGQPLAWWARNALERKPASKQHPIDLLVERLEMSGREVELLLLAGLSEEHEGFGAVFRSLSPANEASPSLGLAAQLLCDEELDRAAFRSMIETGAATTSGSLRVIGDGPFFERSLRLPEKLWSALHGIDVWPGVVNRLEGPIARAGLDEWFETTGAKRALAAIQRGESCTVLITGHQEDAAFERARALIAHAGAESVGILLPAVFELGLEKLIQVHAVARGVVPVFKLAVVDGPTADVPSFESFPGVVVACGRSSSSCASATRPLISAPLERLPPVARKRMWHEVMPALVAESSFLAARYPVEPTVAATVATDLRFVATLENREPTVDDAARSINARGNISLSAGVRLVRPRATWKDLVLPDDRLEQLREAVSRLELQMRVFDEWGFLRERTGARGVRLLFTGPPGTGKTLSAEVLAKALKVELLVVDLSRVVSKWIGETEKNLAAVFDAAERGQAALFFDEADALFGKRTEVVDAHDRYANLETAYLLTRLEQFEGLAILATNLRQNIDGAFLRRLEFVIDFEEPDREERLALWSCHLPKDAPLAEDVNLYELAALYPVVGGVIRNAAVAAGFLAATDGMPIDRRHLIHAIRREYAKAGRSFPGVPIGLTV
jgi:hypothetical protein